MAWFGLRFCCIKTRLKQGVAFVEFGFGGVCGGYSGLWLSFVYLLSFVIVIFLLLTCFLMFLIVLMTCTYISPYYSIERSLYVLRYDLYQSHMYSKPSNVSRESHLRSNRRPFSVLLSDRHHSHNVVFATDQTQHCQCYTLLLNCHYFDLLRLLAPPGINP